ncbi:MAG TPA: hypothetical protein VNQ76_17805 [Planctomicrobium sp.]|nr:hypothetical protein [Planctomicrobium sp.]
MQNPRSNFVPGIVLGIGIGLFLGHLTLWRSPSVQPVERLTSIKTAEIPLFTSPFSRNFQEEPTESALKSTDNRSRATPLQNALAFDSASEISLQSPSELIPVSEPHPIKEPQQLPVGSAVPLGGNSPEDQNVIRELIDLELSHLKPEQRQVWYESLKDLDKSDAVGILKMWRLLGGPVSPSPGGEISFPALPDALDHPAVPVLGESRIPANLVAAAKAIHRDNLLMANTPGFVPLIPVWFASRPGQPGESMQLQYRMNLAEMRRVPTGFPLDVAISGIGFFQVKSESGEEYYTRNGRFELDSQQRLSLTVAGERLTLVPEVRLKELKGTTQSIKIEPTGEVTLRGGDPKEEIQAGTIQLALPISSSSLKSCGNGLFQLSETSKHNVLRFSPSGDGYCHLIQEELEFPMIDPNAETAALNFLGP